MFQQSQTHLKQTLFKNKKGKNVQKLYTDIHPQKVEWKI